VPINFNDLRNFYRLVDGASGWNLDDHIRGSHMTADPAAPAEFLLLPGMELTAAYAAKVTGLQPLMNAFGKPLPFMGGNLLMGGAGSDLIEGKGGDDLIDGDVWLNVQLRAVMNDGTVQLVDSARQLIDDVFADPQRLNPGNITIVRSIVTPAVPAPDCSAAVPRNCDIAVFTGPRSDYDVIQNGNGTVTVVHLAGVGSFGIRNDGTDTLRNIERIRFSDTTINAPGAGGTTSVTVPAVTGLTQAAATLAITNAGLGVAVATANSVSVPSGNVISQTPAADTLALPGSVVGLVVSIGPALVTVPNVVGSTQATASAVISGAGLGVGITNANSTTIVAGNVISQTPAAGTPVPAGSVVTLLVSIGPPLVTVPSVVGTSQAAATAAITGAGLTVTTTTASSATVAAGNVISQLPIGGATVVVGSAVALVVSSGPAAPLGLVAAFGFEEAAGTAALDSSPAPINGTLLGPIRVATGKIGRALSFDGVNDWVTVTDTTASKIDLTTGMTIEAWVNPAAMSGWETVVLKERGGAGTGLLSYALYAHDGAPQAGGFAGPAGYLRPAPANTTVDQGVRQAVHTAIALNTWTHLATTYDGANQRLYINGVLVATKAQTGAIAAANQPLRIGGNNVSGEFFQGLIDEVRIYNRALSAAEITADMTTPIVP